MSLTPGDSSTPKISCSLGWRRSASTATTNWPEVASAHAAWETTVDLPSRESQDVNAITGWLSWNMTAGSALGRTSAGTSPSTGMPSRSEISSAATKRRNARAASAANTAAISPNAKAATATVRRGFDGAVGSSATPSSERTRRDPASRLVTRSTRAAVALAYAWAAAGSVLLALIVTVLDEGSPVAEIVTGTDWKGLATWVRTTASTDGFSASTAIWGISI